MLNFLNKWKRSPRQDRRVVINGVFYEQAPVQHPEPEPEETVEQVGGFQIVTEETNGTDAGASAGVDVPDNGPNSGDSSAGGSVGAEEEPSVRRESETDSVVSDSAIPSPEPSVSEKSQAELEPIGPRWTFQELDKIDEVIEQAEAAEDEVEPMTNTTEIGGGYVAAEITRESLA